MNITRRDFCNGLLTASGAALLSPQQLTAAAIDKRNVGQAWYGKGGIGDYAKSHGNTPEVVNTCLLYTSDAADE